MSNADESDLDSETLPSHSPHKHRRGTSMESMSMESKSMDEPTLAHEHHKLNGQEPTANKSDQAKNSFPWRFGDYEIVGEIARGGMGVVYKARQLSLNRIVALKMILSGQLASSDDVKRFYLEAESAAGLSHPGIVPIYEIGELGGQHFFSMGFVDGVSLAELLKDGPMSAREAAECLVLVCDSIQYAHERGVVHRDLKPGNILLDSESSKTHSGSSIHRISSSDVSIRSSQTGTARVACQPKVTDFGLAKQIHGDSELTNTGQVLGTPSYMPPEQVDCKIATIGPLADVYALGAILYCMLTGRPPFQANNPIDTLMQVVKSQPVSPRQLNASVPKDLETICLKAIEKQPIKRYASAGALQLELTRFLRGEPILARPINGVERSYRWLKRNPSIAAIAGLAVLAFLSFTLLILIANQRLQHERDIALGATRDANEQRGIAQRRLDKAIEAVDKLMARVASEKWSTRPELQAERQSMLEEVVSFYNDFVSESNNDIRVRSEAAKAQAQLANAYLLLNDFDRSIQAANNAQVILNDLIAESRSKSEYQTSASEIACVRAHAYALAAKYDEATSDYQLAKIFAEQAVLDGQNTNARIRQLEADSQFAYFLLSFDPTQGKQILTGFEGIIESLQPALKNPENNFAAFLSMAFARTVEGAYLLVFGEFNQALEKYEIAFKSLEEIKDHHAPSARLAQQFRYTQAIVTSQRGFLIALTGRDPETKRKGITQMQIGAAIFDQLIELNPNAFPFRMQKIQSLRTISTIHRSMGETELARKAERDASNQLDQLVAENPRMDWLKALDAARYSIAWVEQTRTGNIEGFEERVAWFLEKAPPRSRNDVRYNVACAYAVAARFDEEKRPQYLAAAESLLTELFDEGYFGTTPKIQLITNDEDLSMLRERTKFQQLLNALKP